VVSSVQQGSKLSAAVMEKQLASALKKLENYSNLNRILTRKLDASSVDVEIGRYKYAKLINRKPRVAVLMNYLYFRTTLNEQDELIARLVEEKKALIRVTRDQARQLEGNERLAGADVLVSTDGTPKQNQCIQTFSYLTYNCIFEAHIKALNDKIRRLYLQISELRQKDLEKSEELELLKK